MVDFTSHIYINMTLVYKFSKFSAAVIFRAKYSKNSSALTKKCVAKYKPWF